MSNFFLLNQAVTTLMKVYQNMQPSTDGIEGWQSVEDASETDVVVNLHLREKAKLVSFCRISLALSEVYLGTKNLSVEIFATIEGHEFSSQKLTATITEYVMKEYQSLKPIVTESLLHRTGGKGEPSRISSRRLEVKYRVHENLYPQREDYSYEFDEDKISKMVVPYIRSLLDIYNRLYDDDLKY